MAAQYNALDYQQQNPSSQYLPTTAQQHPSPYGAADPYYNQSTGFITPQTAPPAKKGVSKWVKIGVPVLILLIIAGVVGGVLGSRNKSDDSSSSTSSGTKGDTNNPTGTAKGGGSTPSANIGRFAVATDSQYLIPIYPATTNTAAFTKPTKSSSKATWPKDPATFANPSPTNVRQDRPRLFAPQYKWDALPSLINSDPYLKAWNDTIFGNATAYFNLPPVVYDMDGPSGILDNARECKQRIKAFSYVYRLTKDTRWVDRAWVELQNAVADPPPATAPDAADGRWNNGHFLDTAEYASAFGLAYDWLYDVLKEDQKSFIRDNVIRLALAPGIAAINSNVWWSGRVTGNWNCVCNAGLTVAALAILGDDTTGTAQRVLGLTIDNAKQGCAQAPTDDGSWAETPNYWYFGTTGHAELVSALLTATGSDHGILDANPNFSKTGDYHMAVFGPGSLFSYGDHGPNKFSTTANSMFLYASVFEKPTFALFQRDQFDAAEPWSMFWYDPSYSGAFWDGLPLDNFFNNALDQWAAFRSSWTDINALYVAIKAGRNAGLQTHNDLDVGTFVLDALGTRWAGELGSADYRSPGYFNSGDQDALRWQYYRTMTQGQNTLLINRQNQLVTAQPTVRGESSGTTQGSSTVLTIPDDSTAYWTTDMTSAYSGATSVKRGIRTLNKRRQVLLQDEVTASGEIQWRMHTNATVTVSGASATLELDSQKMTVTLLNPPPGAAFATSEAVRVPNSAEPGPQIPDQPNPGVTVLTLTLPAGTYTLPVLFNPQWSGMSASDFVTPAVVALDNWSLTSHN